MAGEITVKFSTQLSLVRRQLTKIGEDLKNDLDQEVQSIAQHTVERLRQTTPGDQLPLGWKVVPLPTTGVGNPKFAITNVDPRANKPVGRGSTRTLLDILEFGTRGGYIIEGKPLAFFWEKLGINVKFRSVVHPGVRPGHFIRPAVAQAKVEQAAASRRLAKRVRQGLK